MTFGKVFRKILSFLLTDGYKIYDSKKYSTYDKELFGYYEKAHFIKIPKNTFFLEERDAGSFKEIRNIHNSLITVTNTASVWDSYWGDNEIVKEYMNEERKVFFSKAIKIISQFITGNELIDIGCGTGEFLLYLNSSYKSNLELTGVDFSEKSIDYCKKNVKNVKFDVDDLYNLNIPDESYANVVSMEVIEHLKYPLKAVNELYRICKKSGRVFITIPNGDMDTYMGHVNFWNKKSIQQLLSNFNVQVESFDNGASLLCILNK